MKSSLRNVKNLIKSCRRVYVKVKHAKSMNEFELMGFDVRKVLILYTGGTIGMTKNNNSVYAPAPNSFAKKIRTLVDLHDENLLKSIYTGVIPIDTFAFRNTIKKGVILYTIKEYELLIDSSNMNSCHWIRIAKDIGSCYGNYDAFIVLQGTDTLAYTASALSFLLENLGKTVIVTGSQIPIFEARSDAKDNFISSLIFSASYDIPEVCVCFANALMRGNRTYKMSSNQLAAFKSPNYPNIGEVGIDYKVRPEYFLPYDKNKPLIVHGQVEPNVLIQPFFPTLTANMLSVIFENNIKGVVLLSYGGGNIPSDPKFLDLLRKAITEEVLIVNVTQCMQGTVLPIYECGKNLEDIGVISGFDMTAEAALAKLSYVLGMTHLTYSEKTEMMIRNLRGELSTS